ncbi:hypothetical protein [Brucella pituitosa]|uniref:Uncharacterized protein n=1 Tax=Brucella pituitosa TaxID=571256 RepID=A0ABS3JZT0_9HYPH|nr:hypothetical protein [Brucella pituitosa]MBO1040183.1 hypothetical protein [Brucella pituitosa]
MSSIETVFSSGLDQLLTFSIGASAGIVGLALAKRAVEYAKSFVGFSDPFSYVHNVEGVESGDFDGFAFRYNGMYFQDESELNDYLLDQNDPNREANYEAFLRDTGYYDQSNVDRYLDDALSDDSASAYDDHEQSY